MYTNTSQKITFLGSSNYMACGEGQNFGDSNRSGILRRAGVGGGVGGRGEMNGNGTEDF